MQKILWLFLSLTVIVAARENPFETGMSPQSTTQIKDDRTNFTSATLTLPSSARILKSASVTFQNLDGSISEEIVAIEQDVDWHLPLILSNQKIDTKVTATPMVIATPETKPSVEKKIIVSPAPIKEEKVTPTVIAPNVNADSTFKLNDAISFFINQNEITIFTKDSKMRDFLITDPYKVVIDFKKESTYPTKTLEFQKAPFTSATLGTHDGFYRIAILLDGQYRYDLQAFNGGYIIKLK